MTPSAQPAKPSNAPTTSQEADAAVGQAPAEPFIATDEIKRAYRAAAKLWHPDLAIEDDDRDARDQAMAALNDAYGRADLDAIRALITDGAPLNQPARTGSIKVTRVRAALAAGTRRLAALRSDLAELRADENWELYQRDLTARRDGRDFLAEIGEDIRAHTHQVPAQITALRRDAA